jgi:hypothetical protein
MCGRRSVAVDRNRRHAVTAIGEFDVPAGKIGEFNATEAMLRALRTTQRSLEMWSVEEPADSEETREKNRALMREALAHMEKVIECFGKANSRA